MGEAKQSTSQERQPRQTPIEIAGGRAGVDEEDYQGLLAGSSPGGGLQEEGYCFGEAEGRRCED